MGGASNALTVGLGAVTIYLGATLSVNIYRRLRSRWIDKLRAKVFELTQQMNQIENVINASPALRRVPMFKTKQVEAEKYDPIQLLDILLDLFKKYEIPKIENQLGRFTIGTCKVSIKTSLIKKAIHDFDDRVEDIVSSLKIRDDLKTMESAYSLKRESKLLLQIMEEFCEMVVLRDELDEISK